MPELPEVETVRRTLARSILGRRVARVEVRRPDIVTGALPRPDVFRQIERRGKQLALIGDCSCTCVHLGMTGSLRYRPAGMEKDDRHVHVIWHLEGGGSVAFRDPRRFGGIWTFESFDALCQERWHTLGEDALTISAANLHLQLSSSRRPIKAALLDQELIAGLGNIYVDELLFTLKVHPLTPAHLLDLPLIRRLVPAMRKLLEGAIKAGGSTVRDYQDADGKAGTYRQRHRVYDRAGEPCTRCRTMLEKLVIIGRTTVFCSGCQPRSKKRIKKRREFKYSS